MADGEQDWKRRRLRVYKRKVAAINALERPFSHMSDEALKAKTEEFKAILAARPEHKK